MGINKDIKMINLEGHAFDYEYTIHLIEKEIVVINADSHTQSPYNSLELWADEGGDSECLAGFNQWIYFTRKPKSKGV